MAENVTTGLRSGRFCQVQGVEEVKLLRCRGGRSFESPLGDAGLVPVDSRQQVEGGTGVAVCPLTFRRMRMTR